MAVFSADEERNGEIDWTILRNGGVCLYRREEIFADDLHWLRSAGYKIVSIDAADWQAASAEEAVRRMHESFKAELGFPDYYGANLDALNDCILEDLVVPDIGGLVLALRHYDSFLQVTSEGSTPLKDAAKGVLSILAHAVRHHMLFGRRLLILVQSDDPNIRFEGLGGAAASWNRREWLSNNRGL